MPGEPVTRLLKDMCVRLVDRTHIDAVGARMGIYPAVNVGDVGFITKSEGFWPDTPTLAECMFSNCHLIVDRSMVEDA